MKIFCAPASFRESKSWRVSTSPQENNTLILGSIFTNASVPRHIWSLEGVSCIISTPLFSISSEILQGSIISSSSAITAHFPIQKASRVSVIKVSKITPEAHKISPWAVSNIRSTLVSRFIIAR